MPRLWLGHPASLEGYIPSGPLLSTPSCHLLDRIVTTLHIIQNKIRRHESKYIHIIILHHLYSIYNIYNYSNEIQSYELIAAEHMRHALKRKIKEKEIVCILKNESPEYRKRVFRPEVLELMLSCSVLPVSEISTQCNRTGYIMHLSWIRHATDWCKSIKAEEIPSESTSSDSSVNAVSWVEKEGDLALSLIFNFPIQQASTSIFKYTWTGWGNPWGVSKQGVQHTSPQTWKRPYPNNIWTI